MICGNQLADVALAAAFDVPVQPGVVYFSARAER
jgi:hypothetical protein